MSFKEIEHTADVGIKITEKTPEALFETAAKGYYSFIIEKGDIQPKKLWKVKISAPDRESLLVKWLNELIYLFETESIICSEISVNKISQTKMEAEIRGEIYDEKKHVLGIDIKATTMHGLEIKKLNNKSWEATVIFDV